MLWRKGSTCYAQPVSAQEPLLPAPRPSCPLPATPAPSPPLPRESTVPAPQRSSGRAAWHPCAGWRGCPDPLCSSLPSASQPPASSPRCRETWRLWGDARIWGGSAGQRDRCSWCTRHRSRERRCLHRREGTQPQAALAGEPCGRPDKQAPPASALDHLWPAPP